jgi:hypothetical protein
MTKPSILFLLKRREDYSAEKHSKHGLSTGLYNSAKFVSDMLRTEGYKSNMEVAIDNNCIDRLVTQHKPDIVVIEALWVVPSKFDVLTKLHPKVKWIVRLHSEMPFMAGEGIAMGWLAGFLSYPQVSIGVNAPRMTDEIRTYARLLRVPITSVEKRVVYLPNYYPQEMQRKKYKLKDDGYVDIGCFGAVRLLKNHLVQAFGALKFARRIDRKLRFHINAGRIEMQGDPVAHNLVGLFGSIADSGHQLVSHEWCPREDFLKVCASMDIGMQCNFSETFNIVGADFISQGVPLVGTAEIPWSTCFGNADPNDSDDIGETLEQTHDWPQLNVWCNQRNLIGYTNKTKRVWTRFLNEW